jgi:hypothetical protein
VTPASALLSPCRKYRYYLQRTWVERAPRLCFIMLNPSTADETVDDATIIRCRARAMQMGMGGLDVVNLFALRATDPMELYDFFAHPVSEPGDPWANDRVLLKIAGLASMVICAWGRHGAHLDRGRIVMNSLRERGVVPHALRINKDGSPGHPLYIALKHRPFPL